MEEIITTIAVISGCVVIGILAVIIRISIKSPLQIHHLFLSIANITYISFNLSDLVFDCYEAKSTRGILLIIAFLLSAYSFVDMFKLSLEPEKEGTNGL